MPRAQQVASGAARRRPLAFRGRIGQGRLDQAPRRCQRGAAVLMALFVATLATLIVSGLFWSQFVLLRTIENQQLVSQSRLLLRGALDWSRAILREDQRTTAQDHLSEPWAQGLAETRLEQLGETSALASLASIAGSIEDAQGRYNLRNLLNSQDRNIDEAEVEVLRRLCELLQVPEAAADLIALRMMKALGPQRTAQSDEALPRDDDAPRPLPLVLPQDLAGVTGLDPKDAAKLAPYVVILDAPTQVNVNTAPPEVIAARFPRMSLADARALARQRETSYFVNTGDVRLTRFRSDDGLPGDAQISTGSRYFLVRGQVKLDRANTRMEALVRRGERWETPPRVIWQREL
ncbi:MAG: type II secretion system minor pseudopilin GspK [Betaproteobacteria bacterium]